MKKNLCCAAFLVLAAQLPLWGYSSESSPNPYKVVPEAVWALATGGGTWVTEVQITNFATESATIHVSFAYSGGMTGPFPLPDSISQLRSVRYSNILATIDSLDSSGFVYYGRVGAIHFNAVGCPIQVQAKTVNGNYGKTFPGLNNFAGITAALGRPMIIQDLVQNATYRTSVGVASTSESGLLTATFTIIDATGGTVGSPFSKTVSAGWFISFNPFVQAGVPSGTYENCWLLIEVTGGDLEGLLMCYGSLANNYTNDTYALIAKMYN